jgi:hypothetical protein
MVDGSAMELVDSPQKMGRSETIELRCGFADFFLGIS